LNLRSGWLMSTSNRIFYRTIYDYIFIGLVICISVASIIWLGQQGAMGKKIGLIYQDGQLIEKTDLSKDQLIHLKNMDIEQKAGALRVLSSTCPYKVIT